MYGLMMLSNNQRFHVTHNIKYPKEGEIKKLVIFHFELSNNKLNE